MRLIMKMEALEDVAQTLNNNSKFIVAFHSWIYNKFKDTSFDFYKSKYYKPFCFSGLLGIKNQRLVSGDIYSIIISSPFKYIIDFLRLNTTEGEKVKLGNYIFKVKDIRMFNSALKKFDIIESFNCVVVTKRKEKGYTSLLLYRDKKDYLDLLRKNLIRKYNYFTKENIDENFNLFNKCIIRSKPNKNFMAVKLLHTNKTKSFLVIGSPIIFEIGNVSKHQLKILNFCYDIGFGEKNSFGFGFMLKSKVVPKYIFDDFNLIS